MWRRADKTRSRAKPAAVHGRVLLRAQPRDPPAHDLPATESEGRHSMVLQRERRHRETPCRSKVPQERPTIRDAWWKWLEDVARADRGTRETPKPRSKSLEVQISNATTTNSLPRLD